MCVFQTSRQLRPTGTSISYLPVFKQIALNLRRTSSEVKILSLSALPYQERSSDTTLQPVADDAKVCDTSIFK